VPEILEGACVLITGGTGSLGKVLARRILGGEWGKVRRLTIFSRDEAKQHHMRVLFSEHGCEKKTGLSYRAIRGSDSPLRFVIGDIRDPDAVFRAVANADYVFSAAALKQVPSCEYHPYEAVRTNVEGAQNLVNVIYKHRLPVKAVVGISTDKACKPVNVMGMTKALQERVFQAANLLSLNTRFLCVRYGNVLASRGSVIPLFHHQISQGGPVTVTDPDMTRFFLTLDDSVDLIFAALRRGYPGETWIPRVPAAKIMDLAAAMVGPREIPIKVTEVRPGEKIHEVLVSPEESGRTYAMDDDYYVISSVLPEVALACLRPELDRLKGPYSSSDSLMSLGELQQVLAKNDLLNPDLAPQEELLR
jgi:UDP-glucose 4-epimerase